MGLLQAAYRTYESQKNLAGVPVEGQETLIPISHMVQKANIEIIISEGGKFISASPVAKGDEKTIIPVTEKSASRTSGGCAHPLSDRLFYLAAIDTLKHSDYVNQLQKWAKSPFTHPKVRAVQKYIEGETILTDLSTAGVITLNADGLPGDGKINGVPYGKCLVRWRVEQQMSQTPSACWQDKTLLNAYTAYYANVLSKKRQELCTISGKLDMLSDNHPKGVLAANFGAKLISSNSDGFAYLGRFTAADQAGTIGYTASRKAHSALRWLCANYGVYMGGRTFLWWNPEGKSLPSFDFLLVGMRAEKSESFANYKDQLRCALGGYKQQFAPEDGAVVTSLEAATTGRLSVTYYNEMRALDLLGRIEDWFTGCCWERRDYGVWSPSLRTMVGCAWGVERNGHMETDDKLLREKFQQIFHCLVDSQPVPQDMVLALRHRADVPQNYKSADNRDAVLATGCAVIRKFRNDRYKEEWKLALDENCLDRSYLFGRLLAIAEHVEKSVYDKSETRETNAIKMQSVFSQRPMYAWRRLEEKLTPYYAKLSPGLRYYYKNIVESITDIFDCSDPKLNTRLSDAYLLGYYHQRSALSKKKWNKQEDGTDEHT